MNNANRVESVSEPEKISRLKRSNGTSSETPPLQERRTTDSWPPTPRSCTTINYLGEEARASKLHMQPTHAKSVYFRESKEEVLIWVSMIRWLREHVEPFYQKYFVDDSARNVNTLPASMTTVQKEWTVVITLMQIRFQKRVIIQFVEDLKEVTPTQDLPMTQFIDS